MYDVKGYEGEIRSKKQFILTYNSEDTTDMLFFEYSCNINESLKNKLTKRSEKISFNIDNSIFYKKILTRSTRNDKNKIKNIFRYDNKFSLFFREFLNEKVNLIRSPAIDKRFSNTRLDINYDRSIIIYKNLNKQESKIFFIDKQENKIYYVNFKNLNTFFDKKPVYYCYYLFDKYTPGIKNQQNNDTYYRYRNYTLLRLGSYDTLSASAGVNSVDNYFISDKGKIIHVGN